MKNKSYSPARVRSASYNDTDNTVDIIWTTGAPVRRFDPYTGDEYDEVLSLEPSAVRLGRLNRGAPFLNTHSSDDLGDVIGSVVPGSARIENGKGLATVKLSGAACDVDVVQKIREGVIKNISVGYWTHHSIRQAGEKDQPDLLIVDDWEPLEVSAVPIPADPGSHIRSANPQRKAPKSMSKEQRDLQAGAAMARRLLQPAQCSEQARGAAHARKLLSGKGKFRTEAAKSVDFDNGEIERGARMARRLLRKA
jgi:hypothetical protein